MSENRSEPCVFIKTNYIECSVGPVHSIKRKMSGCYTRQERISACMRVAQTSTICGQYFVQVVKALWPVAENQSQCSHKSEGVHRTAIIPVRFYQLTQRRTGVTHFSTRFYRTAGTEQSHPDSWILDRGATRPVYCVTLGYRGIFVFHVSRWLVLDRISWVGNYSLLCVNVRICWQEMGGRISGKCMGAKECQCPLKRQPLMWVFLLLN
ncbi:hypothetical protein PO909_026420 [Leuciscus waleckii]